MRKRTIPSDGLQAEGIILLCNTFNWTSIAIVYINDPYGLHLSLGIQQLAKEYQIETTAVAISYEDESTYDYAATQIHNLGVYIIVVIVHNDDSIQRLFSHFKDGGIMGYPYLYLGVDAWFDGSAITEWNLTKQTQGFVGTTPWQPNSLPLDSYSDEVKPAVEQSMLKSKALSDSWTEYYNNANSKGKLKDLEKPGSTYIYGYDALYSLVFAMQYMEDNIGCIHCLLQTDPNIISTLHQIILNDVDFIGASGHVIFDKIGERKNGLYSFGNILENGSLNYFGYFSQDIDGNITYKLDAAKIVWPKYFRDKQMIPRSEPLMYQKYKNIPILLTLIIFVVAMLSILIAIGFIITLSCHRNNKIILAASWRLNIVMCIGSIIGYIAIILYGIDQEILGRITNSDQTELVSNILCNARIWMIFISFTIIFMPLFAKTYRLSRIFNSILTKKVITDRSLFCIVGICVITDITLLGIFTSIEPLTRVYLLSTTEIIDELQTIQYLCGHCSFDKGDIFIFCYYGFILLWKVCEALFGIYVALNVSRIERQITTEFDKFDETQVQIASISFTFVIIGIAIPIFILSPSNDPLIRYLVISISVIFIGNVVLFLNLFPRLYAVIRGQEAKFKRSQAEVLEMKIKEQLRKLGSEQNWWNKVRRTSLNIAEITNNNICKYCMNSNNIDAKSKTTKVKRQRGTNFYQIPTDDDRNTVLTDATEDEESAEHQVDDNENDRSNTEIVSLHLE